MPNVRTRQPVSSAIYNNNCGEKPYQVSIPFSSWYNWVPYTPEQEMGIKQKKLWANQVQSIPRGLSRQQIRHRNLANSLLISYPISETRGTRCWPGCTHLRYQEITDSPNTCTIYQYFYTRSNMRVIAHKGASNGKDLRTRNKFDRRRTLTLQIILESDFLHLVPIKMRLQK